MDRKNKQSKKISPLKKAFIAASIGGVITLSPFVAFHIETHNVASDLETAKRAAIKQEGLQIDPKIVDCIIENSVPNQAKAVVYERWSDRVEFIKPLSQSLNEKAVEEYTLGTMQGSKCILGTLVDELETQKRTKPAQNVQPLR
jgi:hypothetical protein